MKLCRSFISDFDFQTARDTPDFIEMTTDDISYARMEEGKVLAGDMPKILTKVALEVLDRDREQLRELKKSILALISFSIFVVVMILHIPSTIMYNHQHGIISALATSRDETITNNSPVNFFDIETIPEIFDWLNNTFIPQVFVTSDYNGATLPHSQWGQVAIFNNVLGAVQFEAISMQLVECDTSKYLENLYSNCYDASSTTTDTLFINFDTNATDAIAEVTQRKESGTWINSSTQRLAITVVTFNGELRRYAVTELQFDFNVGGFVQPRTSTISVLIDLYPVWVIVLDTLVILWFSSVLITLSLHELWRFLNRLWKCLTSGFFFYSILLGVHLCLAELYWNCWSVLKRWNRKLLYFCWYIFIEIAPKLSVHVFYFIVCITQVATTNSEFQVKLTGLRDEGQVNHDALISVTKSFRKIANFAVCQCVFAAIAIILLSCDVLNNEHLFTSLSILKRTLERAVRSSGAFLGTFAVIFVAYAAAGTVLFGSRVAEFSSLSNGMATCLSMGFGDFDFDIIKSIDYSILYYWSYMAIQTLVILNIALALVVNALDTVTKNSEKEGWIMSYRRINFILREMFSICILKPSFLCCKQSDRTIPLLKLRKGLKSAPIRKEYITPADLRNIFPGTKTEVCTNTINDLVDTANEGRKTRDKMRKELPDMTVVIERLRLLDEKYEILIECLQRTHNTPV